MYTNVSKQALCPWPDREGRSVFESKMPWLSCIEFVRVRRGAFWIEETKHLHLLCNKVTTFIFHLLYFPLNSRIMHTTSCPYVSHDGSQGRQCMGSEGARSFFPRHSCSHNKRCCAWLLPSLLLFCLFINPVSSIVYFAVSLSLFLVFGILFIHF